MTGTIRGGMKPGTAHVSIEKLVRGQPAESHRELAVVPWKRLDAQGPCRIVVTNYGPEVVVVSQPSPTESGYQAEYIVPDNVFIEEFSDELEWHLSAGCLHVKEYVIELPLQRSYIIAFHADNRFRSLSGESNTKRRREISMACNAQAAIAHFPQGVVRANMDDPPDILVVSTA